MVLGEHQEAFYRGCVWGFISKQEGGLLKINKLTSGRRKEPPLVSPCPSLGTGGVAR